MKLISDDKTSKALYEAYLALVKEMEEDSPKEAASFKETFLPDKKLAQSYATLPTAADDSAHYQFSNAGPYNVIEPAKWKDYDPGPSQYYGMGGTKSLYKNDVLTIDEISKVYEALTKIVQEPELTTQQKDDYIGSAPVTLAYGTASYTDIAYPNPLSFEASHDLVEGPAIAECQFCYHKYASRSNKTCPKCGAVNPNLRKRKHEQRQQQK